MDRILNHIKTMEEFRQSLYTGFAWLIAHVFSQTCLSIATSLLAIFFILLQIRNGMIKRELLKMELKRKKECGEL